MGLRSLLKRKKKTKGGATVSEDDVYLSDASSADEAKPANHNGGTAEAERLEPVREDAVPDADIPPGVPDGPAKVAEGGVAAMGGDSVDVSAPGAPAAPAAPARATITPPEVKNSRDGAEAGDKGGDAAGAGPAPAQEKAKVDPPAMVVDALHVLYAAGAVYLLFVLGVVAFFGVGVWETVFYTLLATPLGLGYSWIREENKRRKEEFAQMLRCTPGTKGLATMLGQQPTWLQYTDKEKVVFLNKFLEQAWPFYDKAVCTTIKEVVEPIMNDFKPVGFNRIGFKSITFGDVPIRIEGVRVDTTEGDDRSIIMDLDVRWCGDASIVLAIELTGEATRMAPKITDIQLVGGIRVVMKPLVDVIPGFGAVVVTALRPPSIKFNLDFGKALGGSMAGSPVKTLINGFLKDTLANMLVWPQRMVVPILDEAVTGPLDHLQLHSVGLLLVTVVEAEGLPKADTFGSSDPQVDMFTETHRHAVTTVKKNTLNPKWGEEFYMLVQEPTSQNLMVLVNDIDAVNVSLKLNVVKSAKEALGAKTPLGRAVVPLSVATEREGRTVERTFDLGPNDFSDTHGPGVGCGTITLKMLYKSFESLQSEDSSSGAVIVTVLRCRDLVAKDRGGTSDPYVKVKIGRKEFKTVVVPTSLSPVYNEKFEFFDPRPGHCVTTDDELKVKVYDKDTLSDDFMGRQDIPISDIVDTCRSNGVCRKWYPLEDTKSGEVELKIEFIPFT
ncbi:unnamed protein product [Ostreobium quekettii]|uniref:Uncharacterized protein n=1 Tax=Ostreobium quekettii TaxID=121088 RepID=A0A8S1J5A7_9CHLO|nr:unnamed protein product [Ostreobium quekettii]